MRKISRRNFLLASGAVTISAALSACGGSSSSTGAASSAAASSTASDAPAAQGKVLNIWCWNDEFQGRFNNYYPEVASIAEDKSTTTLKDGTVVKWTINANENNNYQNKLDEALLNQDSAADDDKIDIFLIEADYALKYVDSDYVLDVKKDIGLTDSDLAGQYQYTKDIVSVDGSQRGTTWQATPGLFAYRRSIAKDVLGTDDPAEVQTYLSVTEHVYSAAPLMVSKAAYDAQQQTAVENGPVMEKLLRELVHARNQLARENGFDSFADYGDLSMQRLGYGRAELDEFCRQVQKYITPLYLQMQEQQRQRLGVETLLPYDRALVFPEGNAVPVAAEELPKAAGRMYHALSPAAGHFFDEMVRHDLLDVAGSPNKISGMGFCDMLGAPCGMPFIFANCDGTGSDVTVYTHELGHGLQGYLSYRSQPLADYVGLSPDLAEVHSKTMELLTLPYARDFFGPHAPQFLTEHRYDFIKELCAFCSIHTFETWLYEHPDASLSQWAEEFDRTEKAFGRAQNNEPWRQQVLAGCDLFTNMAIYMLPRYVVSYALSIVCAQQLKAAYDADPVDGWARYHALCASGGSKLYAETLAAAGLELPYAPGVVERLARELAAQA